MIPRPLKTRPPPDLKIIVALSENYNLFVVESYNLTRIIIAPLAPPSPGPPPRQAYLRRGFHKGRQSARLLYSTGRSRALPSGVIAGCPPADGSRAPHPATSHTVAIQPQSLAHRLSLQEVLKTEESALPLIQQPSLHSHSAKAQAAHAVRRRVRLQIGAAGGRPLDSAGGVPRCGSSGGGGGGNGLDEVGRLVQHAAAVHAAHAGEREPPASAAPRSFSLRTRQCTRARSARVRPRLGPPLGVP
jgi:hypothetical protein